MWLRYHCSKQAIVHVVHWSLVSLGMVNPTRSTTAGSDSLRRSTNVIYILYSMYVHVCM